MNRTNIYRVLIFRTDVFVCVWGRPRKKDYAHFFGASTLSVVYDLHRFIKY